MAGPTINIQILRVVSEKTSDDPLLKKFIKEMLFEELEHQGQWWFKEPYKKKIREYSEKWGKGDED